MAKKVFKYRGEKATVTYDLDRCIHAGKCVRGLPEVFDPDRKPWIEPDEAEVEELATVIYRCPTGALGIDRKSGDAEAVPDRNDLTVSPNGPVYVRGDLLVHDTRSREPVKEVRAALCRCGATGSPPYCDNSHSEIEFEDPGHLAPTGLKTEEVEPAGELEIRPMPEGPILLSGPFVIRDSTGEERTAVKGALCRCGASQKRPFCDGSHVEIGFEK